MDPEKGALKEVRTIFDGADRHWQNILKRALFRPWGFFIFEPIIQLLGIYIAFVYGLMYLYLNTIPSIFEGVYKQSTGIAGLHYLAFGVGLSSASQLNARFMDKIYIYYKRKNGGEGRPEYRLLGMIPGTWIMPIGLLLSGWTARADIHWIVPDIGMALVAAGMILNFQCIQTYVIDAFTLHAASALAAVAFVRSLCGFGFPLFAPAMYKALGFGWGDTILAIFGIVVGCPAPFLFWKYGLLHADFTVVYTLFVTSALMMNETTTTVLSPTPPLPSVAIEPRQRIRLMRSTRKLSAVLGTTPQVTEPPPVPPIPITLTHSQGPKPQGKLVRRPATADSEKSYKSFGSTVSEPHTSSIVYPFSSVNSSLSSLDAASSAASAENAAMRKRRPTLKGASIKTTGKRSMEIPPPLVLHLTAPTPRHHSLPHTPSTASSLTPSAAVTPSASPAVTPVTPEPPSPSQGRRKRMAKLTRTLGEKIPPQLVFATMRKPSIPSLRPKTPSAATMPPIPPPKDTFSQKAGRRRSMSVDMPNTTNPGFSTARRSSRVWITWQGEWNRKDIQDVQSQLRNLKAR
ncbi:major facilitator superfamily domain-containing protein [Cristinia sonorae]|uniref:Major facilitator superfamily domain-containing protein n=1 Tax=Cristinia sonorae TaxID=1940300 RepID=A0A8K0XJX6_9AGAR|nr:major facilitator superfamily domain-containing protein [Cristinia sonorae]